MRKNTILTEGAMWAKKEGRERGAWKGRRIHYWLFVGAGTWVSLCGRDYAKPSHQMNQILVGGLDVRFASQDLSLCRHCEKSALGRVFRAELNAGYKRPLAAATAAAT